MVLTQEHLLCFEIGISILTTGWEDQSCIPSKLYGHSRCQCILNFFPVQGHKSWMFVLKASHPLPASRVILGRSNLLSAPCSHGSASLSWLLHKVQSGLSVNLGSIFLFFFDLVPGHLVIFIASGKQLYCIWRTKSHSGFRVQICSPTP